MTRNEDLAVALANLKGSKHKDLMATAEALSRLKKEYGSNRELGRVVGVSGEIVRQFLSLLRLPTGLQELIRSHHIGLEQGQKLYSILLRRPDALEGLARAIQGMTAHDARQLVAFLLQHPELSPGEAKEIVLGAKTKKERQYHVIALLDEAAFRSLRRKATKQRLAVDELVTAIVEEWLATSRHD